MSAHPFVPGKSYDVFVGFDEDMETAWVRGVAFVDCVGSFFIFTESLMESDGVEQRRHFVGTSWVRRAVEL